VALENTLSISVPRVEVSLMTSLLLSTE